MDKHSSIVCLVDVQEKLTHHVLDSQNLINKCTWLLQLAHALNIPIMVSEQYPSGLGPTVEALRTIIPSYAPIEKTHFSCFRHADFKQKLLDSGKRQVVLAGIETHVCVLQTAIDLKQSSTFDVYVVVDAVSSRSALDKQYGLKRMKQAGIELVTSEMVFFEWVECAGTPEFKKLSQTFIPR